MKNILYISENIGFKSQTQALIEKSDVIVCNDFFKIASVVQNQRFDLVVLDIPYLVVSDSFISCFTMVRNSVLSAPLKSLVITGPAFNTKEIVKTGFDRIIYKPVDPFTLAHEICDILKL